MDVTSSGLAGLPRMPVLSGGYVHPSARKAPQMLGHGKDTVEVLARDEIGRIDLAAVRRRLGELDGRLLCCSRPRANRTPATSIHWPMLRIWPRSSVPGCMSTQRSGSSRRCRRAPLISPRAWSVRTPSPPTLTSGSTCPTERVRTCQGARQAGFGIRHAGSRVSPRIGRAARRIRAAGAGVIAAARALPIWATLAGYGRAGLSGAGRAALRSGQPSFGRRRRGAGPGAPGRGAAQRCLFPLSFPNAWPSRSSMTSTAVLPNPCSTTARYSPVAPSMAAGRPCARRSATGAPRRPTLIFWSRLSASVAPTRPALVDQAQLRHGEPCDDFAVARVRP